MIVLAALAWVASGCLGTRLGVRRGLIPSWPQSFAFYVHGAAIGPFALAVILRESA